MKSYKSKSRKVSGVTAYDIGDDFIIAVFKNKSKYTYTYDSAGLTAIEIMKVLALQSKGLSTYIAKYRPEFSN